MRHFAKVQYNLSLIIVAFSMMLTPACRSSWVQTERAPGFEVQDKKPMRVAVLPFEEKSGGMSPLTIPFLPFVWFANLITLSVPEGPPDPAKGAATLRTLLIAAAGDSPLRFLPTRATDTALAHRGLLESIYKMDPVDLGRILGADAILYGELLDWSGHYYIIESRTVVEARLRLVSCLDRRELLQTTIGVSDAAGVSGGPTGYISAAATPLAALGKGPYRELAVSWASTAARTLLDVTKTAARPGAEANAATQSAPYVSAAAISQIPSNGLRTGDWIEVVAIGAQGCNATFDIGTLHTKIPLVESARVPREGGSPGETAGLYRGAFCVGSEDFVVDAPVIVHFTNNGSTVSAEAAGASVTIGRADAKHLGTGGSAN